VAVFFTICVLIIWCNEWGIATFTFWFYTVNSNFAVVLVLRETPAIVPGPKYFYLGPGTAPVQTEWGGGTKRKKFRPIIIIFIVLSIRNAA